MAQGGQVLPIMWDTGANRAFIADDDDVPILQINNSTGVTSAGKTSDGWYVITNPILRVRVTGSGSAVIIGRDEFGNVQTLGTVSGNTSDVVYSEFCINYKVSVSDGTLVEIF